MSCAALSPLSSAHPRQRQLLAHPRARRRQRRRVRQAGQVARQQQQRLLQARHVRRAPMLCSTDDAGRPVAASSRCCKRWRRARRRRPRGRPSQCASRPSAWPRAAPSATARRSRPSALCPTRSVSPVHCIGSRHLLGHLAVDPAVDWPVVDVVHVVCPISVRREGSRTVVGAGFVDRAAKSDVDPRARARPFRDR